MIPVYQTIFSSTNGNCQAASWASLLHKRLEEVPNFIEEEDDFKALEQFLQPLGLQYSGYLINGNRTLPAEIKSQFEFFGSQLPSFGNGDGYYDATVYSPGYFDADKYKNDANYSPVCHAVIVDKDFNIVHDPNPKYKEIKKYPLADVIGYNGVIGVCLWTKN